MDHHARNNDRSLARTFILYLKTRSVEAYGFFAAGFLIAAIIT